MGHFIIEFRGNSVFKKRNENKILLTDTKTRPSSTLGLDKDPMLLNKDPRVFNKVPSSELIPRYSVDVGFLPHTHGSKL